MDQDWMNVKEEAILFARDKIEDAAQALNEILPDTSEELGWLGEQLSKELQSIRGERLFANENMYFAEEGA